jgi:hypothetical protein
MRPADLARLEVHRERLDEILDSGFQCRLLEQSFG